MSYTRTLTYPHTSDATLKDVIGGHFAPGLLEPEPDYPRGIVAVLAAVRGREH
jgi:hypothetical protein